MSDGKQFSVVLPVRNGGTYVQDCVASILAQTRADDFDLLVLDNASTDGTAEWLATLRDPRIRLYPSARPLSIEENWGRILQVPRGEFMTVIGHDDLLDPDYLETMGALIDEHPDAGLYLSHFRIIDADGAFVQHCLPIPARETAAEFLAVRLLGLRDTYGTGYLMRAADYDRVGGIPPYARLLYADDALWMLLMEGSWKATSPRECFSYRLHPQSTSGASHLTASLLDAVEHHQNFLETMAGRDPAVREVLSRYGRQAYGKTSEIIHRRLLLTALGGGEGYPAEAPARLRRLEKRFADPEAALHRYPRHVQALEWLHRLPGGRWIFFVIRRLAAFVGREQQLRG